MSIPFFKKIESIEDVKPFVSGKDEIRFLEQSNGATIGCYMFMDSKTFDTVEALECRGVAFNGDGKIISRPLHKFFNIGEKEWLMPESLFGRGDIAAIYEKLDGSMIATSWDGVLQWRSKKSFSSDVVGLANEVIAENENIKNFANEVASSGLTAIFELTHPEAQIVVEQREPLLRLLHVRDNITGEYVMLDKSHGIHNAIAKHGIQVVKSFDMSIKDAVASLESMEGCEGYVIQFDNGDMVKVKCPWYLRLHKSITFLRERDIAMLSINEELDDVKSSLKEVGIDLAEVEEVESRLKGILVRISNEVEEIYQSGKDWDRKLFAIVNQDHELFGLAMARYLGKEVNVSKWYVKHRLKDDFTLRSLVGSATAEAIDG